MSVLQGLCSFNEKLYAAWKERSEMIDSSSLASTGPVDAQQTVGGNSSAGPALAILETRSLHREGENSDERVFFRS